MNSTSGVAGRLGRRGILAGLASLAALPAAGTARAATFPDRPVRIVVPFAPGGGVDQVCRPLAQRLTAILGQPVVVDNRPGAAGNIGMEHVARSAPDGYTVLHANSGMLTTNPILYPSFPIRPDRDLVPVARVTTDYLLVIVPASLGVRTLPEFIALAKANQGKFHYASGGAGGITHLGLELLVREAGLEMEHVPYKGAGPALTDLMAGRVQMLSDQLGLVKPHLEAGTVRVLATTAPERSELMPELPTLAESGLGGAESVSWQAIMAPAGTPAPVVEVLTGAIRQALVDPGLQAFYRQAGYVGTFAPPQEVAGRMARETSRWAEVIKTAGITIE